MSYHRHNYNPATTLIIITSLVIISLLVWIATELAGLHRATQASLRYMADADMCWQQVQDNTPTCYVVQSGENYYWYRGE